MNHYSTSDLHLGHVNIMRRKLSIYESWELLYQIYYNICNELSLEITPKGSEKPINFSSFINAQDHLPVGLCYGIDKLGLENLNDFTTRQKMRNDLEKYAPKVNCDGWRWELKDFESRRKFCYKMMHFNYEGETMSTLDKVKQAIALHIEKTQKDIEEEAIVAGIEALKQLKEDLMFETTGFLADVAKLIQEDVTLQYYDYGKTFRAKLSSNVRDVLRLAKDAGMFKKTPQGYHKIGKLIFHSDFSDLVESEKPAYIKTYNNAFNKLKKYQEKNPLKQESE